MQWKKARGPTPCPTPEPAPEEKDSSGIIFICVWVAGRKDKADNQNKFLEETLFRMNSIELSGGEGTSTSG